VTEAPDNPAKALRKLLDDPITKREICDRLGLPENIEIDEESFRRTIQRVEDVCPDIRSGECPVDYRDMSCEEYAERHNPATCFVCRALREPYPIPLTRKDRD
jgi:hypothetical protein